MEAYLLMLGSLILIGGSLSDLYGRRRVFTIGVIGFGVTSALCAAAPNAAALVVARGLQGAAGAPLVAGALAVVDHKFDEGGRGAGDGAWEAGGGVFPLVRARVGGVPIQVAGW